MFYGSRFFCLLVVCLGVTGQAATHFVNLANLAPAAPYTNWATAATNIQQAIDAATAGDTVLVSNGIYQTGGRALAGLALTNRVTIDKAIVVQSVNGPDVTSIVGSGTTTAARVRGAYVTNGAVLAGFTITNGATLSAGTGLDRLAGGILCEIGGVVSNCLITSCVSADYAGGVYRGTILDSVIFGNVAANSGGGTYNAVLYRSLVQNNSVSGTAFGGGIYGGTNYHCVIRDNEATSLGDSGGGAYAATVIHGTLVNNLAITVGGDVMSGARSCTLRNCILWSNSATLSTLDYCLTPSLEPGAGNLAGDPQFVNAAASDFHLLRTSPAVDAGTNLVLGGAADFDGNPRPSGNRVDMGAFEVQSRFVNIANPTPAAPFATWASAATNIQDAVDAATAGMVVYVSNGVYQTGGRVTPGASTSNRVVVDKALTLLSVNGPSVTVIRGERTTNSTAMRCVYLGPNAFLSGFTLTNGGTRADGDLILNRSGAGVLCGAGAVVSNCLLYANWAQFGGGISQGTIVNSRIAQNNAFVSAGGLFFAQASACEFLDNSAYLYGGGMRSGTASNCLFTGNNVLDTAGGSSLGSAAHNSTLVHCTVISNIGPEQVTLCTVLNSIVYYPRGLIPLNHDANPNDISYFTNSCTTPLPPGSGNITNNPLLAGYRLSEASPCRDAGLNGFAGASDLDGAPRTVNGETDMGAYEFQVRFVNIANTNPVSPYVTWATAATNIQAAVDTAYTGTVVLVSNGLYQTGGRVMSGALTNRVAIDKPLALRSVNGPDVTAIRGEKDASSGSNGNAAVRCVYLADGASISGFTLTGGATRATGGYPTEQTGGGVFTPSSGVISNCVLAGSSAHSDGGAVYAGDVFDSRIAGNTARLGGGASGSDLTRCVVVSNRAADAGGVYGGNVYNTLLLGNQAVSNAGAAELTSLLGCTVYGNSAGLQGGGARNSTVGNCIVLSNTAPSGPNFAYPSVSSNIFNTCTAPLAAGAGNITNDPRFVGSASGDFRLKADSPCLNAGNNFYAFGPMDLQGNPRVAGSSIDVGAYEYDQALAQYDSDGDTWTDAEEYISATSVTNPLLFFRDASVSTTAPSLTGLVISNTSATRLYSVFRTTNLVAAPQGWTRISSETAGNGSTLTIVITNSEPTAHYRTSVRVP